ncbi:hypothetical protein X943_001889 [Babesia divergens]|uniref:Uncharacterized protein n=1 Tax=Babesia divergens TaxID=32595 RepID=A0AAD9GKR3_BABDI|nr:hypothetical protein X943_001889 [Babesia divergens]
MPKTASKATLAQVGASKGSTTRANSRDTPASSAAKRKRVSSVRDTVQKASNGDKAQAYTKDNGGAKQTTPGDVMTTNTMNKGSIAGGKDMHTSIPLPKASQPSSMGHSSLHQGDPSVKVCPDTSKPFLHKLELYRTALLKCLCRVHDSEITANEATSIIFLPLMELLEVTPKGDAGFSYVSILREHVFNDILLCICFMGKSKAVNGSNEELEQLTKFLYSHAMRVDYMLERIDMIKLIGNLDNKKVVPKNPQTVLNIWTKLLSLVLAKDRKIRIAFCTVTYHIMKNACQDEIEISQDLFTKHVDTFLFLLSDQNKEIRYRCLQLLENFQNENVKCLMLEHFGDPAAAVRMAAVTFIEIPDEIELAAPLLRQLISRLGDVSKDVRSAVYRKLGAVYHSIPVEMCYQIMSYGLSEDVQNAKIAFVQMLNSWMSHCGGLLSFISDMLSQSEDISILETTMALYMKNTELLNTFSLGPKGGKRQRNGEDTMAIDDRNTISGYMKRFLMLSPAEVMLVNVFYQNYASPDEVKLINIMDVISYAHFLLSTFCNIPREVEQIPQPPINSAFNEDSFVDAVESDESMAAHKYSDEDSSKLKEYYSSTRLVCHTLRALLIIAHYHTIEDNYQMALAEAMCDKILLYGPVRSNINGLMSDVVAQTSLGNNSYTYALPSRWLKAGFTFAAMSMQRYIYARKFKLEGKFIGDDIQMEKRHYEVSMTRKMLSIISDIKDPFQTSGVCHISIRREELERMELSKIKGFDPTSYSIEHLNLFDAKLREQMEQTCTQQVELEDVKNSKLPGKVEMEVLRKQEDALMSLLEKQMAFATIIRQHLKDRWTRIMAIVEAFLGQTKSLCSEDAGLAEFPRAILLPQMTFFCSTVVQWQDQTVTDQFCDVLTSKCLGTWCMLNNGKMELWRQLNAFHVALKGALVILEGCINQASGNPDALTDPLRRRIEMQTLRCEMYMTILTDLLVTNGDLQGTVGENQGNLQLIENLKETIWGIVNCSLKSSKYVQSVALRQGCKLLLTEFLKSKYDSLDIGTNLDMQQSDDLAVLRLRGLLELAFIAPVTERSVSCEFKFLKSSRHISITAEDKHTVLSTCALYPTLSFRHLRNFHKVLEQILMRSIHHALQLDIAMDGFSHLISFMIQTILHKSPLYFSMESFAKYFKWLLLITIDKGPVLADKAGFVNLIAALISMFIKRNVSNLIYKFGLPQTIVLPEDETISMSDLCALVNPALNLLDLRDMKVLLNYIVTQGGVVKVKANIKVLSDHIELISSHMMKLARLHMDTLENAAGPVSVEPSEPPQIIFYAEDATAFSDLVDAYDAYISSLGSREMYAQLVEEEKIDIVEEDTPVVSRRMTRAGRDNKQYKCDSDDEGSCNSEDEFVDDEYEDE